MDAIFTLPYSEYAAANMLADAFKPSRGYSVFVPASRTEKGVDLLLTRRDPERLRTLTFQVKASRTYLFVEVDDLAAVERALKPYKIVIPRRVTPYGANETGYREPSGHFVTFAQFPKKD